MFAHADDSERQSVRQEHVFSRFGGVAARLIERFSRKGRRQFNASESCGANRALAGVENKAPNPSPSMVRVHKKCADSRRVGVRIQFGVVATMVMIASEQGLSLAPPAAADQFVIFLDHKVGAVRD